MNKNMKLALLIMATGLVLAGCASLNQKVDGLITTKWDKTAKSTAVLYFDENFAIYKIDGKENINIYGQATRIEGSGTRKAPKARLVIPAGECKLVIGKRGSDILGGNAFTSFRYEVPYTFVAGRYYQLAASDNENVINPKFIELDKKINELAKKVEVVGAQIETAIKNKNNAEALRLREVEMNPLQAEYLERVKDLTKLSLTEDHYAANVEIIDISGGKKKNSPSSIIVVKSWEYK